MANAVTLERSAPFDLAALIEAGGAEAPQDFRWPTRYDQYAFLSGDLVDAVVEAARAAADSSSLEAVVEAKLSDLVIDLSLIMRLAMDLHMARRTDIRLSYDRSANPWTAYLDAADTGAPLVVGTARWYYSKPKEFVPAAKRTLRRWHSGMSSILTPGAARYDVLSRNILLDEAFAEGGRTCIDISANYHDWPEPRERPKQVEGIVHAVADALAEAARPAIGDGGALFASVRILAEAVTGSHFGKAFADLERVRRQVTQRSAGAILAGGTPKHIGRLYAWRYKQLGREVLRFAHGGERAFYDDYTWGLAEVPYCDRYVCHSGAEARLLDLRRRERRFAPAGEEQLDFTSHGSAKHNDMRTRGRSLPAKERSGTVMYVAGGYLGEALGDFPSRKPPDVLYFDWQVSLLKSLRALGYRVVTKIHPRGILSETRLLAQLSDEVIAGYFTPETHDVDCYLFDFAGTAFFDALAASKGIVLLDMGVRPHDPNSFGDLAQRCEIVSCVLQEENRFRADRDELGDAIERASSARDWPESFFTTYFGA